jgi:CRISPR-associated endoribonuclease Cas6
MRLEVILKPYNYKFSIPVNYNFPLSAAIYKIYDSFAPNFADWLHNTGFKKDDGKNFKLFTFSRLFFSKKEVIGDELSAEGYVKFIFSSPLDDSLINNFINGLLASKSIFIGNEHIGEKFRIEKVSILSEPKFMNKMKYKMLSPTVSSIQGIFNDKKQTIFLNPYDNEIKQVLINNLLSKYYIFYQRPDEITMDIEFDKEYIDRKGGIKSISKLITIKESKIDEMKIKCFLAPVSITATPAMQRIVYYCGIGERNSLGFGCLETIN